MAKLTISGVVRDLLSDNLDLSVAEVIPEARSRGLKAPDASIRDAVYTIKADLKKARAKTAPAAAQETAPPKKAAPPAAAPAAPPSAANMDLAAVLANVALVNAVAGECGGVENARRAAEAVQACGGIDAFLQHLDLVAGIRSPQTA